MTWRTERTFGEQGSEQAEHGTVGDDHAVLGVVDDPRELVRRQPQVERVQDGAPGGHGEIGLQVLRAVEHERRDPLVAGDAEIAEGVRQLGGSSADLGVRLPTGVVAGPRGDRGGAVHGGAVLEDATDGEGLVLHGGAHGVILPACGAA